MIWWQQHISKTSHRPSPAPETPAPTNTNAHTQKEKKQQKIPKKTKLKAHAHAHIPENKHKRRKNLEEIIHQTDILVWCHHGKHVSIVMKHRWVPVWDTTNF